MDIGQTRATLLMFEWGGRVPTSKNACFVEMPDKIFAKILELTDNGAAKAELPLKVESERAIYHGNPGRALQLSFDDPTTLRQSADRAQRIDEICDEFESAFLAGGRPEIAAYLGSSSDPIHLPLLVELLRLDIYYRRKLWHQSATLADYQTRFPQLAPSQLAAIVIDEKNAQLERVTGTDGTSACWDGSSLGDFEIVREIDRGGMGVIYEAKQKSLNRKVALKVLNSNACSKTESVQRFLLEAEATARLRHSNIVSVFASGTQDGQNYYAMEFIEGQSLQQFIDRSQGASSPSEPFNFEAWALAMAEVADALDYAHCHGIIHRDVKPSNMLVSPGGKIWINDFGLARLQDHPRMTVTGDMLGTPAYMSPEQIRAGKSSVDHRTDIYSLGATLYELLTAARPFEGENREQLFLQILTQPPRSPCRINRNIPIDLETICLKAMEKDPRQRYQSSAAMGEDLRRYAGKRAISARRQGTIARCVRRFSRSPAMVAGLLFVATTISLASFFAMRANRISETLTQVKQQYVLENALEAATSGDFDNADREIAKAESMGVSDTELSILAGQVAYFRGDFELALSELEQAVESNPDSAAARAMLALCYVNLGDWTLYLRELKTLDSIPPITEHDALFKGYAYYWIYPEKGLKILDSVVSSSQSPLARAIRADVRVSTSEDLSDIDEAERGIKDILIAKEFLPDNSYVIAVSVNLHLVAARLYAENGEEAKRAEAMRVAAEDAARLERWSTLPYPAFALWFYFGETNNPDQQFEYAKRAAEQSTAPITLVHCAIAYCRRGEYSQALGVLDRRKRPDIDGDRLRSYLLAELSPDQIEIARHANEEMIQRTIRDEETEYPYSDMEFYRGTLCLLGQQDLARASYRQSRSRLDPSVEPAWQNLYDFGSGSISDDDLLKTTSGRWLKFRLRVALGLWHLGGGDRQQAQKYLEEASRLSMFPSTDTDLVRLLLVRLKQDPNWPKWIPTKNMN